jgi:aryl-alcohol dehydrogenase-like predicted oxidoreductase
MRRAGLGREGPSISVVGYGAWEAGGMAWGPNPPVEQTIAAMRAAIEAGVNWMDTAEVYGGGRSEELVGRALEGTHDVMVFTKVAPAPAGSGFDAAGVRKAAEGSLERLARGTIDLLQLHWPDDSTPVEETWEAMASLVEEGIVSHIGVSNFGRKLIERCERVRHVDSLQPPFSMLRREGRGDLFEFCAHNGTGIICYGPLAYGLLTGAFTTETTFSDDDWRGGGHGMRAYDILFAPGKFEQSLAVVEELKPVAARIGVSLAQLALAWALHQQGVTGVIAGSRSPEHVQDNAGAGSVELSQNDLDEIERIIVTSSP